jgi:hypothetical protein
MEEEIKQKRNKEDWTGAIFAWRDLGRKHLLQKGDVSEHWW